jgi:WD40 repeat protein
MLFSGVLMCGLFFPVPNFLGAVTGLTAMPVVPGQGPIHAAFALRVGKEAEFSDRFFQCGGKENKAKNEEPVARLSRQPQGQGSPTNYKRIETLAFSPDGKFIASSNGLEVLVWDIQRRESRQLIDLPEPEYGMAKTLLVFTPNAKNLITARERKCQLWEVHSGKSTGRSYETNWSYCSVALSSDGKLLATGCEKMGGFNIGLPVPPYLYTLKLRNLESGRACPLEIVAPLDDTYSITFSPDNKLLVAAGKCYEDHLGFIRVFDLETGKRRYGIFPEETVRSVAISPDGKTLASGGGLWHWLGRPPDEENLPGRPLLSLWETATKKEIHKLPGHQGTVLAVAFSPDGKLLASAGNDRAVRIWEVTNGKALATFKEQGPVHSIAFSPDGKFLASTSSHASILLWDVARFRK